MRGNGDKLILMENGEPEVVVMSFSEYAKIAGAGADGRVAAGAAPAGAAPMSPYAGHATEEQFDMPLHDEWQGIDTGEETKLVVDEWPKAAAYQAPVRLADIRLEDLPI